MGSGITAAAGLLPFEVVTYAEQVVLAVELSLNRSIRGSLVERMRGIEKVLDVEVNAQFLADGVTAAKIHGGAVRIVDVAGLVAADGEQIRGNRVGRHSQSQPI